jgi:hypothetical protein
MKIYQDKLYIHFGDMVGAVSRGSQGARGCDKSRMKLEWQGNPLRKD